MVWKIDWDGDVRDAAVIESGAAGSVRPHSRRVIRAPSRGSCTGGHIHIQFVQLDILLRVKYAAGHGTAGR